MKLYSLKYIWIIWYYLNTNFTTLLVSEMNQNCKRLKPEGICKLRISSEETTVIRLSVIVRYVYIYTHMCSCPQDLHGFKEIPTPHSFWFLRNLFYMTALYLP